jgi:peptide deformylase
VADDLQDTLRDLKARYGRGRGLAAPQIGAPLRLIYIEMDRPCFLVNPEIVDIGTRDFAVWDDCFSIPDLLVRVQRAYRVKVTYSDLAGHKHEVDAEGELAELLQHEIDHLDGVLMVDRPEGLDPFCLREEWQKHYAREGPYGEPEPRQSLPA